MNAFNQPPINHEKNDWHISIEGQNGEWLQKTENKYEINKTWIFKAKNWTTSNNDVELDSRKVFGVKGY